MYNCPERDAIKSFRKKFYIFFLTSNFTGDDWTF